MDPKFKDKDLLQSYLLLDVLRAAAALSVVLYHHQHFYRLVAGYDASFEKTKQPFYTFLSYFYNNGSIAVELFWTISGFVLALNYIRNSENKKTFFRNRFARLYPLHLATLLIIVLLQTISKFKLGHFQIYPTNDIYHFFLNIFAVPFIGLEKDYSFNGPIWSVSVEVISYILFGLLLTQIRNSKITPPLLLVIAIILFRLQPYNIGHSIYESFVFFFFGVTLYRLYEALTLLRRVALGILLFCLFVLLKVFGKLSIFSLNQDAGLASNRLNFLLIFGSAIVLLCVIQELKEEYIESKRRLTSWIGNLTYSTYLIHVPLQILILISIQIMKMNQLEVVSSGIFLITYLLVLVFLSRLSYVYIEKPFRTKLRLRSS